MPRPYRDRVVLGLAFAAIVLGSSMLTRHSAAAEPAPAQGKFLVAARDMVDPNFSRTVVLLLRYSRDGAMGLVINRPTAILPEEVIPDVDGLQRYGGPLFFGGPVQVNVVTFLVRETIALESGEYVLADVQYSGDSDLLDALTEEKSDATRLRVFAGYAGWAPGQLDGEIARGGWHVVPGDADVVFSEDPEAVWKAVLPLPQPITASLQRSVMR